MTKTRYDNAAVFVGGARLWRSINVEVDEDQGIISILNMANGGVITQYKINDVALNDGSTGAFDAVQIGDTEGETEKKVVVQLGCGCSGMRPWNATPEYNERQLAKVNATYAS